MWDKNIQLMMYFTFNDVSYIVLYYKFVNKVKKNWFYDNKKDFPMDNISFVLYWFKGYKNGQWMKI